LTWCTLIRWGHCLAPWQVDDKASEDYADLCPQDDLTLKVY
jgi:hypothetical protein